MRFLKYFPFVFWMIPGWLLSQDKGYVYEKKVLASPAGGTLSSDTLVLDTLSLVPGTVKVLSAKGVLIDPSFYKIDHSKGQIVFSKIKIPADSLKISYQTFPFSLSKEIKHKDISMVRPDLYGKQDIFTYNPSKASSNDIFKTDGLDKSGSISRGVSFGNNQDVIVNSNLNLQLSGKLNNNIDILMSATDNNIPIQPDGNTQQLQQFDKVFIQLSDNRSKLIAGDFQLLRPASYFMNYNKRAQGLNFGTGFQINELKKKNVNKIMVSGAVSKGKFARNQIQGIERNQGPYKLKGNENETYIIVLSGTERIYIDGQLLQRGQENDYIIDYNTAEVRFTPKILITKDKRIIAEFQYSDKNYARSLVQFSDELEMEKLKLRVNLYSEQDAKNQPLQQQLSSEQKLLLANVGDSIQNAVIPSIDSVAFSSSLVLYRKKDTTVATVLYNNVYEYSTDPSVAYYQLSFSFVGSGNGNYNQVNIGTNGKVFQWVAPLSGVKQGSYEPVILLISPKQKQMATISGEYNISKGSKLYIETAASNNDVNTFSKSDKTNDDGYALKLNYENVAPLSRKDSSTWNFKTTVNYEFVNKDFSPIERYRAVEFERDWNRSTPAFAADQHILGGGLSLNQDKRVTIGYFFNSFFEEKNYEGLKHNIAARYDKHGTFFQADGSILNTKNLINTTTFIRSKAELSKKIKWVTIGIREKQEDNQFKELSRDTLLKNSYKFYEWEAFVNNADTTKAKFGVNYKQRTDYALKNNNLNKSAFAENIGFALGLLQNPNSELKASATYRRLTILDTLITTQKPDDALISRLEYNSRIFKGFITSNTFYEIGSGLEAKKEFSFIEVAAGQGTYFWSTETDYNHNGIKELNEFEVAVFAGQGNYIKVYTPTSQYIKTFTNEFSEVLNVKPSSVWSNKNGIRKVLSRFANQTAYRIDRKTTNSDLKVAYNPFLRETKDTSLVTLNSSFRNTVFFNQLSPVFGIDLTHQDNRNKSLLTYGNDSRVNSFNEWRLRWNMSQKFSVNAIYKTGYKYSNSEYLSRNFLINYMEVQPKLNYQPNTVFRYSVSFRYVEKQNTPEYGVQQAIIKDYGMEVKYNILQKGSLNAKANFIQIGYNDTENASLAFEMLEGLKTGKNATWGVAYQRNLSNNTQVSLTYDGRKSQTSKTIHTGGVQVRAYF